MSGGVERAIRRVGRMNRMAAACAFVLAMGTSPLLAEQPDPPGAAALPAGAALTAPSTALPVRPQYVGPHSVAPSVPVTENAGVGTGDAPPAAAPSPTLANGIDGAGNGPAPAASAPTPASMASGVDASGNGPAPVPAKAAAAPTAPTALPRPGVANGIDAAGSAAATVTAAPAPAAPAQATTLAAPATPAQPSVASGMDGAGNGVTTAPATGNASVTAPAPVGSAPATAVAAQPVDPLLPVAAEVTALIARPDTLTPSKKDQEALSLFYGLRQGMPVFVDAKGYNARGTAIRARLGAAGEDGLDPADYATSDIPAGADAHVLARSELQLAVAALNYARQAQSGRFDPRRISSLVTPTRDIPNPEIVLETLAKADDANQALQAFNPPHAGYKALRAKLAEVNGETTPVVAAIASGPIIRPGGNDARIPALRTRLGLSGAADDLTYDPALVDAVKVFQEGAGLNAEGIVGSATLAALNKEAGTGGGSVKADVIANMERWRWLPRDLGAQYVMVNIPEYMARVFDDGKEVFETRIVAGKPDTPTPLLTHDMEYVVVNPAWNIPPSIARNEMMPLLRNNPGRLARMGIEARRNRDGSYSFRQPPGANNALGRIKFMFPNDHSVYLHDTPSRSLFANTRRAFSHGCMRLQDPLMFGEVIFGIGLPDAGITKARISKMLGGSERYINLKHHIPVHVVYFNAFVDDAGKVQVREDIYGINAQVKSLLGLEGRRRMADGATTRKR